MKVYHLSTCDTCKRILQAVDPEKKLERQDIKQIMYTEAELEEMQKFTGSYEALLNKRARKLKDIDQSTLDETSIKALILSDYTFLKRPVFIDEQAIFVGNAKKNVEALIQYLQQK